MYCGNMAIKWRLGGGPSFWPELIQSLDLYRTLTADGSEMFVGPDSISWYLQFLNSLPLKLGPTLLPHSVTMSKEVKYFF